MNHSRITTTTTHMTWVFDCTECEAADDGNAADQQFTKRGKTVIGKNALGIVHWPTRNT